MSVRKDSSGRRSVEVRVEVSGTPEEVWQAIATGPGISCWFVPTEVEHREGGEIKFQFGDGIEGKGIVTGVDRPHKLAYEERDWAPGAPPLATECIVEAQSGGKCIVRMVHSLFTDSDQWDDQMEGFESGWPAYFRILQVYLAHYRGQSCRVLRLNGGSTVAESEAWQALIDALGFADAVVGKRITTRDSAPKLSGTVERIGDGHHFHDMLLRVDHPAPGTASIGAFTWDGKVRLAISLYLYEDQGRLAADRNEPAWRDWMDQRFPCSP
jgi:uncharacterized protein YndB with AHSA1/START domain